MAVELLDVIIRLGLVSATTVLFAIVFLPLLVQEARKSKGVDLYNGT